MKEGRKREGLSGVLVSRFLAQIPPHRKNNSCAEEKKEKLEAQKFEAHISPPFGETHGARNFNLSTATKPLLSES